MMRKVTLLLLFLALTCTVLNAQAPVAVPGDDDLHGYVNPATHEWVVRPQYKRAWNFSEDRALVYDGNHYGFVDRSFNLVVPYIYDDAFKYSNGLATVCKDGKWGAIDKYGKQVIPFKYAWMGTFNDGLCLVSNKELDYHRFPGEFGWVDLTGRELVAPKYEWTSWAGGPVAFVGYPFEIIDIKNGISLAGPFDSASLPWSRIDRYPLFSVVMDGKHGFVDARGRQVVPFIYDSVDGHCYFGEICENIEFVEDRAVVCLNGKRGVIDGRGREILPCICDSIGEFHKGFAVVVHNGQYGLVDRSGHFEVLCEYDEIRRLGDFKNDSMVVVDSEDSHVDREYIRKPVFFVKFRESYSGRLPASDAFISINASLRKINPLLGSFDPVLRRIPVWAEVKWDTEHYSIYTSGADCYRSDDIEKSKGYIQFEPLEKRSFLEKIKDKGLSLSYLQDYESFLDKWYRGQLSFEPEYCIHNELFALRKIVFRDREGHSWTATFIPDDVTW